MKRFLEAYGSEMEFCQIQLNYLDWSFQSAEAKMELLRSCGLPVWVMEPLRGGKLAVLSGEAMERLNQFRPEEKAPAWAFRFLQSVPGVTMILSGMSDFRQPQGLDIPHLLSLYNEHWFTGGGFLAPMALMAVPEDKHPNACIGCRSCEAVCPQQIKISEAMADFAAKLNS